MIASQDLYDLLTQRFSADAAKTALVFRGQSLTYGDLERRVESLSRALAAEAGSLVGICLPRSSDMVASMLAVLRSGAAYVPLDPAQPLERLRYEVEHSKMGRVLTTRARAPLFDGAGVALTAIDGELRGDARERAAVAPDAPAYVIYTSGSTGKPKGVVVPRGAMSNFATSMLRRPGISPSDVLCAVTTPSFDIAVLELLVPLAAGAKIVIATDEEARDPRLLADLLREHRATILQATPVTWQMLFAVEWPGDPSLTALCGGEELTPTLAKKLVPRVRELWNMYGPTETTVWSTCEKITDPDTPISVGGPIDETTIQVLDDALQPVPPGEVGRLFIGGAGVALGYLHDAELTARRFVSDAARGRIYDTGDLARLDASGKLFVLGRSDFQVKLRGFRIELGEIEARLSELPAVEQAICMLRRDDPANPELVVYYTLTSEADPAALRAHCVATLPPHMVPSQLVRLDAFPRTFNGKVDRAALPRPAARPVVTTMPRSDIERTLAEIWCAELSLAEVGVHDNFFELGGSSLAAAKVTREIARRLGTDVGVIAFFEHPSIATLAGYLEGERAGLSFVREASERARARRGAASSTAFDVAIVGVAGRFPGAKDLDELWKNLSEGRESVTVFRRDELDPLVSDRDRDDPSYVPARGVLEAADLFDAAFFGITPNEAELMDPQLRVFMETAWEAFENAGIVGEYVRGPVGVWAGMGNNFYYLFNVLTRPDKVAVMGEISAEIANEKDHIAPRVSHKLNLRGPSLSVHTACSTTLVVIENAYEALVSHQVDVALAGGVDIRTPQKSGQRYEEGGVFSVDGHCRPFDAQATGTMFGEGAGAVVLKRLDDALRDGDTIHAVIKGAAVNHDGGRKVSYLAPSVDGEARVIASALALGDVDPDTITMLEAHGTATPIGDPIEVEALTRVYRAFTRRRRYCALGSIKGNFGHATTAAGIAGVLKVVLSMQNRVIPPTLHFTTPNPRIDFEKSPFFVADRKLDWTPPPGVPRRAGVSSFGFCGTNAHVVLEEAPSPSPSTPPRRPGQLVLVSARSRAALDASAERIANALRGASDVELADRAYTTQVGRKRHEHRRCAVVSAGENPRVLTEAAGPRSASLHSDVDDAPVAFVFPGQGAQYVNMGRRLHEQEPVFRDAVDACAKMLEPVLGCDVRAMLFVDPADTERATQSLNDTFYTQPLIYTVSYALASLYRHWGIAPSAMIGHSIGEFVAATLAGVMDRDDALRLVATRGRLMRALPRGSMLTVRLPVEKVLERLPAGVDVASVNAPELCVVAGPTEALERFAAELEASGVSCRKLHTSHAFHSSMMDPAVEPFLRAVEQVKLSPPRVPFVSTVTGAWITPAEATDPQYWARHLRSPVQFSKAVRVLLEDRQRVLLECGPRQTSTTLALQHRPENPGRVIATMPEGGDPDDEPASVLLALGSLWMNGARVDWSALHEGETRRRVPLPTYPFQRKRFWIEPGDTASFGRSGKRPIVEARETCSVEPPRASHEDDVTSAVAKLLEELLGHELDDFDPDARFIALGLDSLLLTQLARAVRTRIGFEVTFRQLTERYTTTKLLVDAIRASRASTTAAPSPQARSLLVRLHGDPNEDALARALRALPERHRALGALSPARVDLTATPADAREAALQRTMDTDASATLPRASIIVLDPKEIAVLLTVDEAVCDAWSLDVLLADLARLYSSFAAGEPAPPPAQQPTVREAHLVETVAAPAHVARRTLSPGAWRALGAFAREHELSPFAVLFAAFAATLRGPLATRVAGHPALGLEDAVGALASLVEVRCRTTAPSFVERCRAIQSALLDARERAVPGTEDAPADASVLTHVKRYAPGALRFAGCTFDYDFGPRVRVRFPVEVDAIESADALELRAYGRAGERELASTLEQVESVLQRNLSPPELAIQHPTPYGTLTDAARSLATRYKLRACAAVGAGSRAVGRVWIRGGGRVVLGERVLLDGSLGPIELHVEKGAELVIGDDVVIEGGTSIEATRSIAIGPRSHLGLYCKLIDSNFHRLDERRQRPLAQPIVLEEEVSLEPHVIVLPGARVPAHASVAARSVVRGTDGR